MQDFYNDNYLTLKIRDTQKQSQIKKINLVIKFIMSTLEIKQGHSTEINFCEGGFPNPLLAGEA